MFQRVFVLDSNKKPLAPCHPARANELLRKNKAFVYRRYPFTIMLKHKVESDVDFSNIRFEKDKNGAKLFLFRNGKEEVVWTAEKHQRSCIKTVKKTYSKSE